MKLSKLANNKDIVYNCSTSYIKICSIYLLMKRYLMFEFPFPVEVYIKETILLFEIKASSCPSRGKNNY